MNSDFYKKLKDIVHPCGSDAPGTRLTLIDGVLHMRNLTACYDFPDGSFSSINVSAAVVIMGAESAMPPDVEVSGSVRASGDATLALRTDSSWTPLAGLLPDFSMPALKGECLSLSG